MKFDSNRAWIDAIAAVSANRHVLLAVAGVFFLLPTLLSTVFLTDVQAQMLQSMGKPEVFEAIFYEHIGLFLGFGIGGMLVQGVGYLTVMALLSDRGRPTVGEAIMVALRALPALIGAALLTMAGMFMASMVFGLVLGGLIGFVAGTGVASVVVAFALIVLLVYLSVKFSLVVPVVINEGTGNPVAAMTRSWQLTRHNSLRLFGFFLLLTIGYLAIAFMVTVVVVGPAAMLLGEGQALTLLAGVISGTIGAVASVILIAVLAYTHRQLAGPSAGTISQTFE
ncbi:glycerophosphoryl diester phosphodiesterase membrane domain-containing protein [Novosphingobium beihaiensis]|uniref:Glycerophosphoryl diester phosphodiesterase membrane domain-containing protein n=1 Tax=Novosphingobium beihaiensis TaxID=2930389 RepID=A0ABT0BSJ3_9SPHN|nr:glycerophosphoryl diester phosphodiesterase membrane domain-containing protein [Novosphingobium beihaiensis]MCJ2188017.1 glycerophosphoryl diester phosphodiesterase membrane domain-containing protein [Novosphingobium beihaiensis]